MWRRIGAVVVAKFTIVALIDHPMMIGWREFGDVALIPVDAVEQRVE
jgi:hypothetical protein